MKYDVCVFGGCSLDQMFYQNVDGTYNSIPDSRVAGGKGANQAVAAARAGAKTIIISKIGSGEIAQTIIDNLKYNYVSTFSVETNDNVENDYSNIYINIKDKDNDIKRFGNAIESFDKDMIYKYSEIILNSTIIVCQLKCPIDVTEELIDFCYENNKILILTPCRPEKLTGRFDLIDKVSYITCNEKECCTIFGTEDIESCVNKYPNKLIVTLGKNGLIFHNGQRIVKMPAIDVEVVDTTGAGDTLNGNLSYLLSQSIDLQHALRKAMYASAMKIQVKSAQAGMPYKEELEKFISDKRNKNFGYSKELDFAIDIVKDAYFKIKSNRKLNISTKSDNSVVTDADITIEKYLLKIISKEFKNDNFLTEETYPNNKLLDRTWIIDPIDGTSHFVNNTPFWGIQLAFYDKERVRFSVIYLPKTEKLYYAFEGHGSYLNNNRIILNPNKKPLNQCIVEFGGSLYKEFNIKKQIIEKLIHNNNFIIGNILHINSCCVSYSNLVSEQTDALVISTKKKWDIMPGIFLCQEAGMKFYNMDFENKLTLITNNEELKDILLSPLKK